MIMKNEPCLVGLQPQMKQRLIARVFSHRFLPWAVSLVVAVLMSVSLVKQWHQLQELLHEEPVREWTHNEPKIAPGKHRDRLFGEPRPPPQASSEQALPSSMTLVGSFVHAQGERSSAIIAVSGRPPRLFKTGEQLVNGVILSEVQSNHVILSRGQSRDPLFFPDALKAATRSAGAITRYGNLTDAHLEKLQGSPSRGSLGVQLRR